MIEPLCAYDDLLRGRGRFEPGQRSIPVLALCTLLGAAGLLYGLAMGSFSGRVLQSVYTGLKVPLLLIGTSAVCLPSFFVLNALLGLRDDFPAALRAVLAAQVTVATGLAALVPLIFLVYASTGSYAFATFANGVHFALAALCGQRTMHRHYAPLRAARPAHETVRRAWVVLYTFVAIQLAWVGRPFVGDPDRPVAFLRENAWSNAYVIVLRDVLGIL